MTSARDLITAALEDVGVLGVGQTPLAEDINGGLIRLNRMLAQWNRRRWMIYHLVEGICTTNGNNFYTIGPTNCDITVPVRPDKLELGNFVRQLNGMAPDQDGLPDFNGDFNGDFGPSGQFVGNNGPIDYPLELIESRETYNLLAMKFLTSWPSYIYYDAAWPAGRIYLYPVPAPQQFNVHVLMKQVLGSFANLSDDINLPPDYEEALEYSLAMRFFVKYQIEPNAAVVALAKAAMATIRSANTQIPLLQMPDALNSQGSRYNIYSDQCS